MEKYLIHGANDSINDTRNVKEVSTMSSASVLSGEGGKKIKPECILDQNRVGICTAISNVQAVFDRTGARYSEDFQYLIQKKYFDGAWYEGSSVLNSLKASLKYGYLPKAIFDGYFARNENEDYATYSARLKTIADNETLMQLLLSKCEFPLKGFTQLQNNLPAIAEAIFDQDNIVLVRYTCGSSWFYKIINAIRYSCWEGENIEPITDPIGTATFPLTGHAVSLPYINNGIIETGNTWSKNWCLDGHAKLDYMPTEAYKMYFKNFDDSLPLPIKKADFKHEFKTNLTFNIKYSYEVELLQYALIFDNCMDWIPPAQRGFFGTKTFNAVRKFQSKYGILTTGFVGPKTLAKLNQLYNK